MPHLRGGKVTRLKIYKFHPSSRLIILSLCRRSWRVLFSCNSGNRQMLLRAKSETNSNSQATAILSVVPPVLHQFLLIARISSRISSPGASETWPAARRKGVCEPVIRGVTQMGMRRGDCEARKWEAGGRSRGKENRAVNRRETGTDIGLLFHPRSHMTRVSN